MRGREKEAMVGNEARSDLGVSVFAVETSLGRASGGGGVCSVQSTELETVVPG